MAETGRDSLPIEGQQLQTVNTTDNEKQDASSSTTEDIPNVVARETAPRNLNDILRIFSEEEETPNHHFMPPPNRAGSEVWGQDPLALPHRDPHQETAPDRPAQRPVSLGVSSTDAPFYSVQERLGMPFNSRIYQIGIDELIYYDDIARVQKVNIASLQRFNIHAQQAKILGQVEQMIENGELGMREDLAQSLEKYVTAVRDHEYSKEIAAKYRDEKDDPFLITSRMAMGARLLAEHRMIDPARPTANPQDEENPILPGGLRTRENRRKRLQNLRFRLATALFGGAALVGPMLIMILVDGLVSKIVTTCVSVLLFGLIVACAWEDAKLSDVMGAVAAYTAVLVVFVGAVS